MLNADKAWVGMRSKTKGRQDKYSETPDLIFCRNQGDFQRLFELLLPWLMGEARLLAGLTHLVPQTFFPGLTFLFR